ncbi:CoA transferase, partial [Amnibacterium endophyticum]
GGAAAAMRPAAAWAVHPQGAAVRREALIARAPRGAARSSWAPDPARPLAGVRVLDLTRVIAGPVAGRALAGYGAEVLRIDPPGWDEPAVEPDMTLGKRCARLDATTADGRERLLGLLAGADVLLHGYRRDALDGLGLGEEVRRRTRPGLVEVALTAYGWTGPWAGRRGFDSLVQMSAGVAERGAAEGGRPVPLPVQALDHATGWFVGAAAVAGLRERRASGAGSVARLSLARTAAALQPLDVVAPGAAQEVGGESLGTPWGEARLASPPLAVAGAPLRFDLGPAPLGSADPAWND